jgi:hypothetical protein
MVMHFGQPSFATITTPSLSQLSIMSPLSITILYKSLRLLLLIGAGSTGRWNNWH